MHGAMLLAIPFFGLVAAVAPIAPLETLEQAPPASCNARENLDELAVSFISRCCKASIYREFPAELLFTSLGEIQRGTTAAHRKAWKLLNDNRFKK